MTRQYYGIEDLGMTAQQRQTLVQRLRQLGANNQHRNPCMRNHWRPRLDNQAVIFEAAWNSADWTVDSVKSYLATLFGINPATIGHATQQTQYGPAVTFSRNGDKLRVIAFGGAGATYAQSHTAVRAFLRDYATDWKPPYEE